MAQLEGATLDLGVVSLSLMLGVKIFKKVKKKKKAEQVLMPRKKQNKTVCPIAVD